MKREALFRIWNGIEMVYDVMVGKFGIFYVNPSNDGIDENDNASLSPFNTKYSGDIHVMQFTGMTIKTTPETKVFVGDRVLVRGTKKVGLYETPVVESQFGFTLESNKTSLVDSSCLLAIQKVLGNIYDNTESL